MRSLRCIEITHHLRFELLNVGEGISVERILAPITIFVIWAMWLISRALSSANFQPFLDLFR